MKRYDFDTMIDRHGTCSIKTDFLPHEGLLPLWIADMDFPVADEIVAAIKSRADHPIYGYGYLPGKLFDSFRAWHHDRHGADYNQAHIIPYYSVVAAIRLILTALTAEGDGVTILTPAYLNFKPSVEEIKRTLITCPLQQNGTRFEIDFEDLDHCLERSKVLLFCSPHNPVGRVWTKEEYARVAMLCERHGVILLADEIHSDLIMPGERNVPAFTLGGNVKDFTIAMLSATKTFNLAQAGFAFIYTENAAFEMRIRAIMEALDLGGMNVFATTAVEAAYAHGAEWLDQVLEYVRNNYQIVAARIAAKMPLISLAPLEGTYLAWVDCRRLGVPPAVFFEMEAKIYGDDGILFGAEGEGFYRLNLATPRCVVEEMLRRMEAAYCIRVS